MLPANGYRVIETATALDQFNQNFLEVDIVVCDVHLGTDKGVALVQRMLAGNPRLRAVLMSGYDHAGALAEATFLKKPFTAVRMVEALRASSSTPSN